MIKQPKNTDMSVDIRTGAFRYHTVDLVIPARGFDFRFERWNDSFSFFGFQKGWGFDWDERLTFDPSDGSISYWLPNFKMQRFVDNGDGTYSPAVPWIYDTLEVLSDTRIRITLQNGQRRIFDRESGRLLQRIDLFGNTMSFEWIEIEPDPVLRIAAIRDATGRTVTGTWGTFGYQQTLKLTDWTGRVIEYRFRDFGGQLLLENYIDPEGNVTFYEQDSFTPGFVGIRRIELPNGTWVRNSPVGEAPLINMVGRQEFGNGRVIEYAYDPDARTSTITEDGKTWTFEWDEDGNLSSKTDPLGNVWSYTYNSNNLVTEIVEPNLATVSMTYDANGNMLTRTNQKGKTWTYEYHPTFNKVTKITGPAPLSYVTEMTYDATTGAMLTKTDPRGKTTSYDYFANGLLREITDPNTNTVEFAYSPVGYLTQITNGLGKITHLDYDLVGNLTAITDPLGNRTTRAYDRANRLTQVTSPLGNTTRMAYDGNSNVVTVTDPLNRGTRFLYSTMNDLQVVRNAAGGIVGYDYDLAHNLVKQTDPNGNAYEFAYDALDRQIRVTDPMGQVTVTAWDAFCGNYSVLNPENELTTYARDVTCLLTRRIFQDFSSFDFTYDVESRRTAMTQPQAKKFGEFKFGAQKFGYDPADTTTFEWDGQNNLTAVNYPGSNTIAMARDDGSRLIQITDIHGMDTDYVWDAANRLVSVTRDSKTTTYEYDDADRVTRLTYPNGVTCDYTWDADSRILRMLWTLDVTVLYDIQYDYDAGGNRTRRTVTKAFTPAVVEDFSYDGLSRLVRSSVDGSLSNQYRFDPAGNRLLKKSPSLEEFSDCDASDELVATNEVKFRWDRVGRLVEKADPADTNPTRYAWNYASRLRELDSPTGSPAIYRYNADELRTYRKGSDGTVHIYHWGPVSVFGLASVLNETDGGGSARTDYIVGPNGSIGFVDSEGEHYYVYDALSSVLALTDDLGAVTDSYGYDEYGVEVSSTGTVLNSFRFGGQQFDADTGLYYLRYRYYAPDAGRFLRRDPLGPVLAGNTYAYARGNPVGSRDPSGLNTPTPTPSPIPSHVTGKVKLHDSVIGEFEARVRFALTYTSCPKGTRAFVRVEPSNPAAAYAQVVNGQPFAASAWKCICECYECDKNGQRRGAKKADCTCTATGIASVQLPPEMIDPPEQDPPRQYPPETRR